MRSPADACRASESSVQERVRELNDAPTNPRAQYVLYCCQKNRRVDSNHALVHAVNRANELGLPVLYYESWSCSGNHENDRMHAFVLEGVPEQAQRLERLGIGYCFRLPRSKSDSDGALEHLSHDAACVVGDDYPASAGMEFDGSRAKQFRVRHEVV